MTRQADPILRRVHRLSSAFAGWAVLLAFSLLFAAAPASAATDRRVALVIGNSSYQLAPVLPNPKNDATDFAATLKKVGFEVIEATDVDKRGMDAALAQFSRQARGASVALFYFAGDGMQYNGVNYILPVDAHLQDDVGLRYETVSLDQVRSAVDEADGVKIMILDACRNNPLATDLARSLTTLRGVPMTRGLARVEQSTGTVVAYATQANQVAEDGGGRNSPFTTALIENVQQPGVEIGSMFRRVANSVYEKTQGRQVPELSISLLSDFYLNQNESDMQAWARIRDKADPPALRDFLAKYPSSLLADAARARLDAVENNQRDRLAREERDLRERLASLQRERATADDTGASKSIDTPAPVPTVAAAPTVTIAPVVPPPVPAPAQQVVVAATPAPVAEPVVSQVQTIASLPTTIPVPVPVPTPAPAPAPAQATRETQQLAMVTPAAPPVLDDAALYGRFKTEMRRLGCYGAANETTWDGVQSKKALALFAKEAGLAITPVRLDDGQLDGLQTRKSRLCASLCNVRQAENGKGQCVAKTCDRGEVLTRDGDCVQKAQPRRAIAKPATRATTQPVAQRQPRQQRAAPEQIETVHRSCSPGVSVGFGFGPARIAVPVGRSC